MMDTHCDRPAPADGGAHTGRSLDHIEFSRGILGFPDCRRFRFCATQHAGMYWIEAADGVPLRFVLVDPFQVLPDYAVDLTEEDLADLRPLSDDDIAVLAVATLSPAQSGEPWTLNLQGPIAINVTTGRARQTIVRDREYGVRRPFDPGTLTLAAA